MPDNLCLRLRTERNPNRYTIFGFWKVDLESGFAISGELLVSEFPFFWILPFGTDSDHTYIIHYNYNPIYYTIVSVVDYIYIYIFMYTQLYTYQKSFCSLRVT